MKLLAFDLDGTLLTDTHEIKESTLNSIKKCVELGWKWCIVTGRSYQSAKPILDQYNLTCDMILNTGHHYISEDHESELTFPMDYEVSEKIITILKNYEFHTSIHTDKGTYIFQDAESFYQEHIDMASRKRKGDLGSLKNSVLFNKEQFMKRTQVLDRLSDLKTQNIKVLKIDARTFDETKREQGLKHLKKLPNIMIHSSYGPFIELSENSANKATTLDLLRQKLNLDISDVYVFGDSMNDLEMFEHFPNSIAMENAKPTLKKLAKWVTDSNNDDGIENAINLILEDYHTSIKNR